ncbi:MAG: hypothetical protein ILA17_06220 [Ruminococcus sp.]|nr:hypothetical protein [Ruminiclostridium sp.]MBP1537445.1 hypothetical protein [Ruminococcus sp.]
MIQMICGSTAIGTTIYSEADGAFSADEATEKRLVSLGVAKYVDGKAVATSTEDASSDETGVDIPADENAAEDVSEDVSDIPVYSVDTPMPELKTLAKNAGISFKVGTRKEDLVKMLDEYYGVGDVEDFGLETDDVVV